VKRRLSLVWQLSVDVTDHDTVKQRSTHDREFRLKPCRRRRRTLFRARTRQQESEFRDVGDCSSSRRSWDTASPMDSEHEAPPANT